MPWFHSSQTPRESYYWEVVWSHNRHGRHSRSTGYHRRWILQFWARNSRGTQMGWSACDPSTRQKPQLRSVVSMGDIYLMSKACADDATLLLHDLGQELKVLRVPSFMDVRRTRWSSNHKRFNCKQFLFARIFIFKDSVAFPPLISFLVKPQEQGQVNVVQVGQYIGVILKESKGTLRPRILYTLNQILLHLVIGNLDRTFFTSQPCSITKGIAEWAL